MTRLRRALAGTIVAGLGSALVAAPLGSPSADRGADRAADRESVDRAAPAGSPLAAGRRIAGPNGVRSVVAVSIDGLNPEAVRRLGPERAPTLHRLMAEGASTLNARTSYKRTETLPNHTGMVTGRNIDRRWRGHGVEHNVLRPGTVQQFAGHPVGSVYTVVGRHGGKGGLFVSKDKLVLFKRSWSRPVRPYRLREDNRVLVTQVRRSLAKQQRAFRLVHLSGPDVAGHRHGFMSAGFLDAVERADAQLGRIVAKIEGTRWRRRTTTLIVTADHGGQGGGHGEAGLLANHRIPFLVWGRGVAKGADLYDLNADYADPADGRPRWGAAKPPVRNSDVANLALDMLGLPAVKGSRSNRAQDLDWN